MEPVVRKHWQVLADLEDDHSEEEQNIADSSAFVGHFAYIAAVEIVAEM